jgi:hypothetical protein|tara:strand:+ start:668 stop:907 length:240 start_codon:yes stop_codon:yes gene_type:complete
MTFYYDSFSLHSHLLNEGFHSIVSEGEFYLEIDENDKRLNEFFKIVKFNLSDHQFIFNTLQEIENEKTQDELYDLFLNG